MVSSPLSTPKVAVTGTRGIPNIQGGIETHCEELFPRVATKGFDITIFRRKNYVNDQLSSYKGVSLYDLPNFKKKSFETIFHTLCAVWNAKWKLKADIVHIHAIGPAVLTPLARMLGLKVVFTHHGPDYNRAKWGKIAKFVLQLGERTGCRFANEVIVISNVINETIRRQYKRCDAYLIYNGVPDPVIIDDTSYLHQIGIDPHKFIFTMGRFVPEKNFHTLIKAFANLKQSEYKLVIAGDADIEDNYSKELKRLAKDNDIILPGIIKEIRLQALLSHACLFVLPSSHEGLPIALLEALSYRLPVIVSDIPANRSVGLSEDCYFPPDNEMALSRLLEEKLKSKPFAITYDLKKYNWDTIAEETAQVYNKLMNRSNSCEQ